MKNKTLREQARLSAQTLPLQPYQHSAQLPNDPDRQQRSVPSHNWTAFELVLIAIEQLSETGIHCVSKPYHQQSILVQIKIYPYKGKGVKSSM